jgi:hypothetical protein
MVVNTTSKPSSTAAMEDSLLRGLPERRKHVRYVPVQEEAFAALGAGFSKVGRITSISMGGLTFEYTVFHEAQEENSSVEIFLSSGALHIHHVPCKVVVEEELEAHAALGGQTKFLSRRRCRVRFTEMTAEQQRELEAFIRSHTSFRLKS